MGRMEFGPSVISELHEILVSTSEGVFSGPDAKPTVLRDVPFLRQWHLSRLAFDPEPGRSRIVCVLTGAGKDVTATADASDFPDLRDNRSSGPYWNGSGYHDLAVHLLSADPGAAPDVGPADFSADEVPIRRPADRTRP